MEVINYTEEKLKASFKDHQKAIVSKLMDCKDPGELENELALGLVKTVKSFPKARPRSIHEAVQRALEGNLDTTVGQAKNPVMESDGTPLDEL